MISALIWRDFLGEQGFEIDYLTPTVRATKTISRDLRILFEADGQVVRLSGIIGINRLNFSGFKYRPYVHMANPGAKGGAELVKVVGLLSPNSLEDIKAQIEALIIDAQQVLRQIEDGHGRL